MNTPDANVKRVPCEVYSRIVGYLRPVQNWHVGKRQEYRERKMFVLPASDEMPAPEAPLGSDVTVEAQ
ncbi:MAG: hypothetical protein JW850_10465 [Thermoflexales bacterium]|nr:hypothetical protein [Thermoflexales bacterium]